MLGGSRGNDPRADAAISVIRILSLVAEPEKIKQALDELRAGLQPAIDDLALAEDQQQKTLKELADAQQEHTARLAGLNDKEKELAKREADCAQVEKLQNGLDGRKLAVDKREETLSKGEKTLQDQRDAFALDQKSGAAELKQQKADQATEIEENRKTAQALFDRQQAELTKHDEDIGKAQAALDKRSAALAVAGEILDQRERQVEVLQKEYEQKLSGLRALVS